MPLTDFDSVKKLGNLGKELDGDILVPHLLWAEMEMKRKLTDKVYALIEGYKAESDVTKKRQADECAMAEAYLTLSSAIHSLNIETQGNGVVSVKGWGDTRSELASRATIKDLAQHWYDKAMSLISPYIPASEISEDDEDGEANDIDLGSSYMSVI